MSITNVFLIAAAIMLIAFDAYAYFRWGYVGTISYDLLTDTQKRPIIGVVIGIIIGHLFWPQ